jgi:hypothetical protein
MLTENINDNLETAENQVEWDKPLEKGDRVAVN